MEDVSARFSTLFQLNQQSWVQLVDIAVVAFLIYKLLLIVRNTRAWRILGGIVVFIVALVVSEWLNLHTLHWILDRATALAPVALVILLLPELRQALEGVARLGLWPSRLAASKNEQSFRTIDEIVSSCSEMASSRIGAIVVIERQTTLEDIVGNGVRVEATLSAPLLTSIFFDGNPLHDGAVIVRGDQIVAAACRLPLSENESLSRRLHMRHRAAVGITEQSDAVAIVISEERGTMSLTSAGQIRVYAQASDLRQAIMQELGHHKSKSEPQKGGEAK